MVSRSPVKKRGRSNKLNSNGEQKKGTNRRNRRSAGKTDADDTLSNQSLNSEDEMRPSMPKLNFDTRLNIASNVADAKFQNQEVPDLQIHSEEPTESGNSSPMRKYKESAMNESADDIYDLWSSPTKRKGPNSVDSQILQLQEEKTAAETELWDVKVSLQDALSKVDVY